MPSVEPAVLSVGPALEPDAPELDDELLLPPPPGRGPVYELEN